MLGITVKRDFGLRRLFPHLTAWPPLASTSEPRLVDNGCV